MEVNVVVGDRLEVTFTAVCTDLAKKNSEK